MLNNVIQAMKRSLTMVSVGIMAFSSLLISLSCERQTCKSDLCIETNGPLDCNPGEYFEYVGSMVRFTWEPDPSKRVRFNPAWQIKGSVIPIDTVENWVVALKRPIGSDSIIQQALAWPFDYVNDTRSFKIDYWYDRPDNPDHIDYYVDYGFWYTWPWYDHVFISREWEIDSSGAQINQVKTDLLLDRDQRQHVTIISFNHHAGSETGYIFSGRLKE